MLVSSPPARRVFPGRGAVGGKTSSVAARLDQMHINQSNCDATSAGAAARATCLVRNSVWTHFCRCHRVEKGSRVPARFRLADFNRRVIVFVEKGQLQRWTGGGVASRFRNSTHCSTPTREENTSVEPAANQRPRSFLSTPPTSLY